jgi:hypothetical protein
MENIKDHPSTQEGTFLVMLMILPMRMSVIADAILAITQKKMIM